ncbi:transporter [Paraglaciecola chathamensis]|uniref:transporter n=1 Tax=Paraglaciecola chathamensis TaxID=368405 RepID=UPI0026FDAB4E|nr:transporter [Paraglaciecola chathamensis]MDO6558729.1 transporter [Paraglaciecola chathamensis]
MEIAAPQLRLQHFTPLSKITLAICLSSSSLCYGADNIAEQNKPNSKYEAELERQRILLIEQGQQIEKLTQMINALTAKEVNTQSAASTDQAARRKAQADKPAKQTEQNVAQNKPVGQAPPKSSSAIEASAIPELGDTVSGVLTGKGTLVLEPSFGYSYTDNNRVFLDAFSFIPALVVGLIDLREIKRHSFIGSISARYGITERWEVDLKVPYIGRNDSQRSRPVSIGVSEDEIFNASGHGIGDIELSTRYQLNTPTDGGPIYVANLVATIPTGTSPFEVEFMQSTPGAVFPTELPTGSGYVSIQPSITAIYATDPGVFFGNLSYGYNMDTDEEVGNVDPGDSAGMSFGLGVSFNERTSMSLSYSHKHVLKSKINNMKIDGSQLDIGQLIIGYSFRYSLKTNISLSLAIGVTDDAQDTRLNFRLPVTL